MVAKTRRARRKHNLKADWKPKIEELNGKSIFLRIQYT